MCKKYFSVLAFVVMAIMFSACSSDGGDATVFCSGSNDCAAGEQCSWNECYKSCENAGDCTVGMYCHPEGVCTQCAAQSHCNTGFLCIDGKCNEDTGSVGDSEYGLECDENTDCLGGEICLSEHCTPLCQSSEECIGKRGICHEDNYCVQCVSVVDCNQNSLCENYRCISDGSEPADGDIDSDIDGDFDTVEDSGMAQIAEACHFKDDDQLPQCDAGLKCLYNSQTSFCSMLCDSDDDCMDNFKDGCCGSFSDDPPYCLTKWFCDRL